MGEGYNALHPQRLLDSRKGTGTPLRPFTSGERRELTVTGVAGVPSAATAVVLSVTATRPVGPTAIRVFPTGSARPVNGAVYVPTGITRPNMVVATIGAGGRITIENYGSTSDVIVDVFGYFGPNGDGLGTVSPKRVLDTRNGTGGFTTAFGPGMTRDIDVVSTTSVPATASAVIVNLTADDPTGSSYMTAFPTGSPRPYVSNMNWRTGDTVPVQAIVPLGDSGQISLFNYKETVQVMVDVVGYFDASSAVMYHPMQSVPAAMSSANPFITPSAKLTSAGQMTISVGSNVGVPSDAVGFAGNLAGVKPSATTYLKLWPAGQTRPATSAANIVANDTHANAVISAIGSNDSVNLYNRTGTTGYFLDVTGWFR